MNSDQRVQPQNRKKQQSIVTKATDSNTITKLHTASSIENSSHLRVHAVEKSKSGHWKMVVGNENPNSGHHRKAEAYQLKLMSPLN
ncbi:hypothetical protein M5689_005302 [Euphorbia peplus]|nr:hypothetical protein M5689_005302 [Euphorbia peplus]